MSSFLTLPNEMIEMIFLELNDLNEMLKCRLVSRRCKQVVNGIRITGGLTVVSNETRNWKDQSGQSSVLFQAESLNFLNRKFIKKIISRVKRLAISTISLVGQREFNKIQTSINQLKQLDNLQFGPINLSYPNNALTFRLSRIRTFTIDDGNCLRIVKLTAPQLTRLVLPTYSISKFELVKTSELSHLVLSTHSYYALSGCPKDKIKYLRFKTTPGTTFRMPEILSE